jgi:tRNA nucleotidyltransferase/poly(A) polymerase
MNELVAEIGRRVAARASPAYFVGGCVRDMLRGERVKDLDFVVTGDTHALGRSLANAYHGHVFWLREEEGVARVLLPEQDGLQIDLTVLRGALEEDLLARDLTINAMASPAAEGLRAEAPVLDPAGGRADLASGTLRFVSPSAPERDPLRTLRALRFRWKLGFQLLPETAELIRRCVPLLERVSSERVRDELFQLLAMPGAGEALADCLNFGMARWLVGREVEFGEEDGLPSPAARVRKLQALLEELRLRCSQAVWEELEQLLATEPTSPRRRREVLLWAAALQPLLPVVEPVAAGRSLALSGEERQLLAKGLAAAECVRGLIRQWPPPGHARLRLHRRARPAGPEAVLLAAAVDGWADAHSVLLEDALERHLRPEPPLLSGADVMRILRIKPGPVVGRVLEALEEARADGAVGTAAEAVEWVRSRSWS